MLFGVGSEPLEIVFRDIFDRHWAPGASLGAIRAAGPKHVRQSRQNAVKIEALRLLWGRWGHKVAPRGGQDGQKWPRTAPPEGSGQSFGGLWADFIAKVAIS